MSLVSPRPPHLSWPVLPCPEQEAAPSSLRTAPASTPAAPPCPVHPLALPAVPSSTREGAHVATWTTLTLHHTHCLLHSLTTFSGSEGCCSHISFPVISSSTFNCLWSLLTPCPKLKHEPRSLLVLPREMNASTSACTLEPSGPFISPQPTSQPLPTVTHCDTLGLYLAFL